MAHINQLGSAIFSDLSISLFSTKTVLGSAITTYDQLLEVLSKLKDGPLGIGGTGAADLPSSITGTVGWGGLFQTNLSTAASTAISGGTSTADAKAYVRLTHVKEFPAMGTPANIVNVPIYGRKNSLQIQGQADSPTMEITVNYVPNMWAGGELKGGIDTAPVASSIKVGDGKVYLMRFSLLNKEPKGYNASLRSATSSTANSTDENSIGESVTNATNGTAEVQNSSFYFLGKIETIEVTPSLSDATTAKITIAMQSDLVGAYTIDYGTATQA
jgi:hypothetical protein